MDKPKRKHAPIEPRDRQCPRCGADRKKVYTPFGRLRLKCPECKSRKRRY